MSDGFRFNQGTFQFGGGDLQKIDFVKATSASKTSDTHFTLLMGANGTYKSRALAGCVDFLCQQNTAQENGRKAERSECCVSAVLRGGSPFQTIGRTNPMPSRVLALSNLVRDRFTFDAREQKSDPDRFYHYLGVRQANNMTTTGAMDRIVADAFLDILPDPEKTKLIFSWISRLFPRYEIALGFYQLSVPRFERFLDDPKKFYAGRLGSARPLSEVHFNRDVLPLVEPIRKLLPYIISWQDGKRSGFRTSDPKRSMVTAVGLNQLSSKRRDEFALLSEAFEAARRLRLLNGPITLLRDQEREGAPWIELTNLSSGEQNLLSTGARLIAYAIPESFIVIDEPELSLNVSWQQRYIELVENALSLAKGSHVVIASHSPHLVASLEKSESTVVVAEIENGKVKYASQEGEFFGWGAEAVLYKVLDIPSASNYEFTREISAVLQHIQEGGKDRKMLDRFIQKSSRLELRGGDDALAAVVAEIKSYREGLGS